MNTRKNSITTLVFQFIAVLQGFILNRLIIGTFGSEINGLIFSITQFLSFISLLEGGLGAVVLAELYEPIEEQSDKKIKDILYACQSFFNKLAVCFILYTIILAIGYPFIIGEKYDFLYTFSLVLILSFSTLAQYLFAITNKLFLQARQKLYIINLVSSVTLLLNLLFTVIIIKIFPEIHVVKIAACISYLIQPIVFNYFVEKKYRVYEKKSLQSDNSLLKERWSGFVQNLAHFVNLNTDIAVITIFLNLSDVSVYTVYMFVINGIRIIITSLPGSYQSVLGKLYAEKDKRLRLFFNRFSITIWNVSLIIFSTCLLLINQFVAIYTRGVNDADYYQPWFALIIVLAGFVFCIREPHRYMILAAGKFEQTNFGAVAEAIINLTVSIYLVRKLGLLGVAVGTLVASVYRFAYFIRFLRKDVLYNAYKNSIVPIIVTVIILIINIFAYFRLEMEIDSYVSFCVYGAITVTIESVLVLVVNKIVNRFLKVDKDV